MSWECQQVATCPTNDAVFAILCDGPVRLIASFYSDADAPESIQSRLVSHFSDRPDNKEPCYFASKEVAIEALVKAVREAWSRGHYLFDDISLNSSFHVKMIQGQLSGTLVHESKLWDDFISLLQPLDQILGPGGTIPTGTCFVSMKDLTIQKQLTGQGSCFKVSILSLNDELMVYKGLSFFRFLTIGAEAFGHQRDACYREIRMINAVIPPHPNIVSSPRAFVSVPSPSGLEDLRSRPILGTIYTFQEMGSLSSLIDNSIDAKSRIPLDRKAKWCYQLVSAIHHVHFKAGSWHQDIKPPNMLLDDNDDLIVIDWEKYGANSFVLAPEADGSFDVREISLNREPSRLVYTPYDGPTRVNTPFGMPKWNVFPDWNEKFPRSVELAEVYSLGSTMWLLMEEVAIDKDEREDYCTKVINWSERSKDIPFNWKDVVAACTKKDPNERITMTDLLAFWEAECREHQLV